MDTQTAWSESRMPSESPFHATCPNWCRCLEHPHARTHAPTDRRSRLARSQRRSSSAFPRRSRTICWIFIAATWSSAGGGANAASSAHLLGGGRGSPRCGVRPTYTLGSGQWDGHASKWRLRVRVPIYIRPEMYSYTV